MCDVQKQFGIYVKNPQFNIELLTHENRIRINLTLYKILIEKNILILQTMKSYSPNVDDSASWCQLIYETLINLKTTVQVCFDKDMLETREYQIPYYTIHNFKEELSILMHSLSMSFYALSLVKLHHVNKSKKTCICKRFDSKQIFKYKFDTNYIKNVTTTIMKTLPVVKRCCVLCAEIDRKFYDWGGLQMYKECGKLNCKICTEVNMRLKYINKIINCYYFVWRLAHVIQKCWGTTSSQLDVPKLLTKVVINQELLESEILYNARNYEYEKACFEYSRSVEN
jgi:hypothetical protein